MVRSSDLRFVLGERPSQAFGEQILEMITRDAKCKKISERSGNPRVGHLNTSRLLILDAEIEKRMES
jgi:hypothetical protein